MRLPLSEKLIWDGIQTIQDVCKESDESISRILNLTESRYRILKNKRAILSASAASKITSAFPVSFENLTEGKVDRIYLDEVCNQKNHSYIPEKYQTGKTSKLRSSISTLDYVEAGFGKEMKRNIISHLQVGERVLTDPNRDISPFFINDICMYMRGAGAKDFDFFNMGLRSFDTNKTSPIATKLQEQAQLSKMYEVLVYQLIPFFEENSDYWIKSLTGKGCLIQFAISKNAQEVQKQKIFGGSHLCLIKAGIASSLPKYVGMTIAAVKKTQCQFNGDSVCEFEVDFGSSRASH